MFLQTRTFHSVLALISSLTCTFETLREEQQALPTLGLCLKHSTNKPSMHRAQVYMLVTM